MNWTPLLLFGAVVATFLLLKRLSLVSASRARELLKQGALIVDVRSPGEFQSGHIPQALNIPLGELHDELPRRVKDKQQPLLLHCLSGGRSGIARHQAKSLGYSNVFNLGSLSRAQKIAQPE
jgi:phage shock protein E